MVNIGASNFIRTAQEPRRSRGRGCRDRSIRKRAGLVCYSVVNNVGLNRAARGVRRFSTTSTFEHPPRGLSPKISTKERELCDGVTGSGKADRQLRSGENIYNWIASEKGAGAPYACCMHVTVVICSSGQQCFAPPLNSSSSAVSAHFQRHVKLEGVSFVKIPRSRPSERKARLGQGVGRPRPHARYKSAFRVRWGGRGLQPGKKTRNMRNLILSLVQGRHACLSSE